MRETFRAEDADCGDPSSVHKLGMSEEEGGLVSQEVGVPEKKPRQRSSSHRMSLCPHTFFYIHLDEDGM